MPIDAGMSTKLMTLSAAVIGDEVPALMEGDIVDVYVMSQLVDYSQGRAPVILRRVCSVRDEACLDGMRRTQEGRVAGVELKGGDKVASGKRSFSVLASGSCSIPRDGCRGGKILQ